MAKIVKVNYYDESGGFWGFDTFNEKDMNIMENCIKIARSQMERDLGVKIITKTFII